MVIVIQNKVQPSINSIHLLHVDNHKTSSYSYPRVAVIRIDVYLTRETWYTWHIRTHDKSYAKTFHTDATELDRVTDSKKKGSHPNSQYDDWPILGSPPGFSPPNSHWSSEESQSFIDEHATSIYWAHISSIWLVHSILAHGYQPIPTQMRATTLSRLSTTLSSPFPIEGPLLSPKCPTRSQVNNSQPETSNGKECGLILLLTCGLTTTWHLPVAMSTPSNS
jgi:hypothetical protein